MLNDKSKYLQQYLKSVERQIGHCEEELSTLKRQLTQLRQQLSEMGNDQAKVANAVKPAATAAKVQPTEVDEPKRLIRIKEVIHLTGLARSTIYSMLEEKQFPKPVRLSERSVAWVRQDIDTWIDGIIRQRDYS